MPDKKSLLKKILVGFYLIVLVLLGARIFFESQFSKYSTLLFTSNLQEEQAEKLTIAYALAPQNLDPTHFDSITRSRLNDIYEGLVRTDRNLKVEPALAISWGLLSPSTWEFKLRPNVQFHDGRKLQIEDVVKSLEQARTLESSQLKNLLSTIKTIETIDQKTIHIQTTLPDPLLLSKLAVTYIYPRDQKDFKKPVGTGPYQLNNEENDKLNLKYFPEYWGKKPHWKEVVLQTIPQKEKRLEALKNGTIDILADVPPADAKSLENEERTLKILPSLEVNALMFNLKDPLLGQNQIRKALTQSLDSKILLKVVNDFANPVNQFVSSGIFGFNPDIKTPKYDLENSKTQIAKLTSNIFERIILTFDYPKGLDVIGQYVQNQFQEFGIEIKLNPLSGEELEKKIRSGKSQLYYLGWKSELGDANDFLQSIVHSKTKNGKYGQLNGSNYADQKVDELIEASEHNLDLKSRLESLQKIMQIIVEKDVIGIPLFESETIFAYKKSLTFEPRLDSSIYASEIE